MCTTRMEGRTIVLCPARRARGGQASRGRPLGALDSRCWCTGSGEKRLSYLNAPTKAMASLYRSQGFEHA